MNFNFIKDINRCLAWKMCPYGGIAMEGQEMSTLFFST